MKKQEIFNYLFRKGIFLEDALAYVEWLRMNKGQVSDFPVVQFAYMNEDGTKLWASPELKDSRLEDIWGLCVAGTFWCRWHIYTLKYNEINTWVKNRELVKIDGDEVFLSDYDRADLEYFYGCSGSAKLRYGMPTVKNYKCLFPYLKVFSDYLKVIRDNGQCVQDWFFKEQYWAYDEDTNKLVVFNLRNGVIKPFDKDEMYALRPIWLV